MSKLILDVSNVNPIDASSLYASGSVALICKATEGTSFKDATLSEHRSVAAKARVPFGSYLFLHPDSKGSEAGFYLEYAKPKKGDLQPIVDAEALNLGSASLARRSFTCLHALELKGYKPILYASSSVWKDMITVEPRLLRYRVWEAQYPGKFTRWLPWLAKLRVRLLHGVSVVLWQWTDDMKVNGKGYDASLLLTSLDNLLIK